MAEERHSFLQTAFMAVVGCTLVHIGFGLTGFDGMLHDFTDALGGTDHAGHAAEELASNSLEVPAVDTHVDPHEGHDHGPGEHHGDHAFNNSSGVRDLYPQQEYSLAA